MEVLQQRVGSQEHQLWEHQRLLLVEIRYVEEFSAFLGTERCKPRLTEITPLTCTSALWGQSPKSSHSGSARGSLWGVAAV